MGWRIPSFRARLEEYVRLGGTIVAFAQQHGGANPKSQRPNRNAVVSIVAVTLCADGAPAWSYVIGHLAFPCRAYARA
jgi:hypothetical protein